MAEKQWNLSAPPVTQQTQHARTDLSDALAEIASLRALLSEKDEDAKRWRYFREFMTVEDDQPSGGQYLFIWDDKIEATFAPGFENTVDSLVDQRIAQDAAAALVGRSPETPE